MSDREAFLAILSKDPDDLATRLIYSDWLEEHDQPEEADRMRQWPASKQWMLRWLRSINYNQWEYDEETGERLLDENGEEVPARKDNLGDPHTFEDALQAGYDVIEGRGSYCWGTDDAADFFRSHGPEVRLWWHHWSILTGVPLSDMEELVDRCPFYCAC